MAKWTRAQLEQALASPAGQKYAAAWKAKNVARKKPTAKKPAQKKATGLRSQPGIKRVQRQAGRNVARAVSKKVRRRY